MILSRDSYETFMAVPFGGVRLLLSCLCTEERRQPGSPGECGIFFHKTGELLRAGQL